MPSEGEITGLLAAVRRGDRAAESQFLECVYDQLHRLARRLFGRERPDHTLQPTALVHEAYLRLLRSGKLEYHDRVHFLAIAATVMRRILIDHARRRAGKRPGNDKVEINEVMAAAEPRLDQLLILDQALSWLATWDHRPAKVVELLYFGGLTELETSAVLGASERTVKRDWSAARAWIQAQLTESEP